MNMFIFNLNNFFKHWQIANLWCRAKDSLKTYIKFYPITMLIEILEEKLRYLRQLDKSLITSQIRILINYPYVEKEHTKVLANASFVNFDVRK